MEIPSILACDVGNSGISFTHVKGDEVAPVARFRMGDLSGLGSALAELWEGIPPPRKLVASSVNPSGLKALEAAAEQALHEPVLVVGRDLPLPMETELPHPASCGTDRLCAAAAAFDRLGVACIVADFGTAITVDCVNDEGVFLGGAILPGLRTGARSLEDRTAQLPNVEIRRVDWVFGRDTEQAIVGGLIHGARGALRELVESYASELGHWPIVICTGGDAVLVCDDVGHSDLVQAIVPDLALRGIAIAYYRTLLEKA
jgi:type III pantothenate kinase